ncbi:hypothetical protein X875_10860 [Mannheimia varigena USDA-ARS-USMARC-1388]|nr:hypothetical protein X875_10860 [Mannheimia varigena USDA-ARS-USMARC-1388]
MQILCKIKPLVETSGLIFSIFASYALSIGSKSRLVSPV